jgi:hypothetical protein
MLKWLFGGKEKSNKNKNGAYQIKMFCYLGSEI